MDQELSGSPLQSLPRSLQSQAGVVLMILSAGVSSSTEEWFFGMKLSNYNKTLLWTCSAFSVFLAPLQCLCGKRRPQQTHSILVSSLLLEHSVFYAGIGFGKCSSSFQMGFWKREDINPQNHNLKLGLRLPIHLEGQEEDETRLWMNGTGQRQQPYQAKEGFLCSFSSFIRRNSPWWPLSHLGS